MNITFGAAVLASDGRDLGRVAEVVIDPQARAVTHVVIREGLFFDSDRQLPLTAVARASAAALNLNVNADEVERLTAAAAAASADAPALAAPTPSLIPPGLGRVELTPDVTIPIDRVLLTHDSPVETSDGTGVGRLRQLRTGPDGTIAELVLETGLIHGGFRAVPAVWITRLDDNEVLLGMSKADLDRLPELEAP